MKRRALALFIARLLLGAAFLTAGLLKVSQPADLADAIDSFQLIPPALIPLLALTLPCLEIIIGALLLTGLYPRKAAFAATALLLIYTTALASALLRGLPLECDCFGSPTSPLLALLRDAVLLATAIILYLSEATRPKT